MNGMATTRQRTDRAAVELTAHRARPIAGEIGEQRQDRPGEHDDGGCRHAARPSVGGGRGGSVSGDGRRGVRATVSPMATAVATASPASAQPTARCSAKPWIDGVAPERTSTDPIVASSHGAEASTTATRGLASGPPCTAASAASHTSSDVFSTGSHAQ